MKLRHQNTLLRSTLLFHEPHCTRVRNYPSKTLAIFLLSSTAGDSGSVHFGVQRYCSNGRRYLPQKSTKLTCSTRLSKYTPAHRGLTHCLAVRRNSHRLLGSVSGEYSTTASLILTTLAANSFKVGAEKFKSLTNRLTSGLSRRLSSLKSMLTISWGNVVIRLPWRLNDLSLLRLAKVAGMETSRLLHRDKARKCDNRPNVAGTCSNRFPPT